MEASEALEALVGWVGEAGSGLLLLPHADCGPFRLGASLRSAMEAPLSAQGEEDAVAAGRTIRTALKTSRLLASGLGLDDDFTDIDGLLAGHGLLSTQLQIRFVHDGPIRVVNRLLADSTKEAWLSGLSQRLMAYASQRLAEASTSKAFTDSARPRLLLWICVGSPELTSLFAAASLNLIEFSETTYIRPLEPILLQPIPKAPGLRVRFRKAQRDLETVATVPSTGLPLCSSHNPQCCRIL